MEQLVFAEVSELSFSTTGNLDWSYGPCAADLVSEEVEAYLLDNFVGHNGPCLAGITAANLHTKNLQALCTRKLLVQALQQHLRDRLPPAQYEKHRRHCVWEFCVRNFAKMAACLVLAVHVLPLNGLQRIKLGEVFLNVKSNFLPLEEAYARQAAGNKLLCGNYLHWDPKPQSPPNLVGGARPARSGASIDIKQRQSQHKTNAADPSTLNHFYRTFPSKDVDYSCIDITSHGVLHSLTRHEDLEATLGLGFTLPEAKGANGIKRRKKKIEAITVGFVWPGLKGC